MAYHVRGESLRDGSVTFSRKTPHERGKCLKDLDSSRVPVIVDSVQTGATLPTVACLKTDESANVVTVPCR